MARNKWKVLPGGKIKRYRGDTFNCRLCTPHSRTWEGTLEWRRFRRIVHVIIKTTVDYEEVVLPQRN